MSDSLLPRCLFSVACVHQGAAAALADARRDMANIGHRTRRPRRMFQDEK